MASSAVSSSSSSSERSAPQQQQLQSPPSSASQNQDLPGVLDALTTGKATFYNHVKMATTTNNNNNLAVGRLILTAKRLAWYPEEDPETIKVSWNQVTKYHVSSSLSSKAPQVTLTLSSDPKSCLTLVMNSQADLERLKTDFQHRLTNGAKKGLSKKKKTKHRSSKNPTKTINNATGADRRSGKAYGIHIPTIHETPPRSVGQPESVMIVYKTKTGSDVSFTHLVNPDDKDTDNNHNNNETPNNDNNSTTRQPQLTSTSLPPEETVSFIHSILKATEDSRSQNNDVNNDQGDPNAPSSIVIATLYKERDTKLGMVLGHRENEKLCIAKIADTSILRDSTPLKPGMEVLFINNTDCQQLDSPSAAKLIQGAVGTLTIIARQRHGMEMQEE